MRDKYIPDDYVGSVHLKNWFVKHLCMDKLKKVYIPVTASKCLTSLDFDLGFDDVGMNNIYLEFDDHVVKLYPYLGGLNGKHYK